MIKVTYEVKRTEIKFLEDEDHNWRQVALANKPAPNATVLAIEACICGHCGRGSSLVGDKFICENCNSR